MTSPIWLSQALQALLLKGTLPSEETIETAQLRGPRPRSLTLLPDSLRCPKACSLQTSSSALPASAPPALCPRLSPCLFCSSSDLPASPPLFCSLPQLFLNNLKDCFVVPPRILLLGPHLASSISPFHRHTHTHREQNGTTFTNRNRQFLNLGTTPPGDGDLEGAGRRHS